MSGIKKIFICSNRQQNIAAQVSKSSILRNSSFTSSDVEIISKEDFGFMNDLSTKEILREGRNFIFAENDMQNFTLLRFHIPQLMDYQGTALVIDPDIFLVRKGLDDLFDLDFNFAPIYCRPGPRRGLWSTSVMVFDAAKLRHWCVKSFIDEMSRGKLDYSDLINLKIEKSVIKSLPTKWNEYDDIKEDTILLHTTEKITQPWRAGLKMSSSIPKLFGFLPRERIYSLFGRDLRTGREHPVDRVTEFFFNELKHCINNKTISYEEIDLAISQQWIRSDIMSCLNI
jgi:hypothetical protein